MPDEHGGGGTRRWRWWKLKPAGIVALAVLATTLGTATAAAQDRLMPDVVIGTRIRFVRDVERTQREGTVVSRTGSAALVRDARDNDTIRVALDSLRELSIGIPRSVGAGAARGGAIGLGVGAGLTVAATTLVWLSDADERCNDCLFSATAGTLVLGALGTVALALGGTLIGASAPGWTWMPAPRILRLSTDGRTLRLGARLTLR